MAFLHQEGENILREYGHHPSFRMMALGNELWGDIDKMKEFVDRFPQDSARVNIYFWKQLLSRLSGNKRRNGLLHHLPHRRRGMGQIQYSYPWFFSFADAYDGGMINHFHPNSTMNFDEACKWQESLSSLTKQGPVSDLS